MRQALEMADAERGMTGDGAGGICYRHDQTNLLQCRGERGTDAKIPPDGPRGAPRERIPAEQRLMTAEVMLSD